MVWPILMYPHAKFCQTLVKQFQRYGYFSTFQDGGRLPSLICGEHFATTHKEYLKVFIIWQNLVEIHLLVFSRASRTLRGTT